jgi:hypothetical protein
MIESYCSDCGLFIAGSPASRIIEIMENLHQCKAPFPDVSRERLERLMQDLAAKEHQLMQWIQTSERNTRWFATDPLSAIRAANLGIDDHVLQQLEMITLSIARKLRQSQ